MAENVVGLDSGGYDLKERALSAVGLGGDPFGVRYQFSCAGGGKDWEVRTLTLDESLSAPYTLAVQLVTESSAEPLEMLGQSASIQLERASVSRHIHGIVASVQRGETKQLKTVTELVIRPALSALAARRSSRVFQSLSAPDVIKTVISEGIQRFKRGVELRLERKNYPVREYIVQYQETDLEFVQRMMAEEGIWYCFEFPDGEGKAELLVLKDSNANVDKVESHETPVAVDIDAAGNYDHELVTRFVERQSLTVAGHSLRQFDWTNPTLPIAAERAAGGAEGPLAYLHEAVRPHAYEKGEAKYTANDVNDQLRLRNEYLACARDTFLGSSNVIGFRSGTVLQIEGHPQHLDGEYLVVSVRHLGQHLAEEAREDGDYGNEFECIRIDTPFRSKPAEHKPKVASIQSAIVVGPDGTPDIPDDGKGDAIHVDEHGRVQVRFVWDNHATGDDGKPLAVDCWVRCAQTWAGPGWGMQFIPRIGMEVVVTFLDGDPDRPLITGCVYNGTNAFPYALTESDVQTNKNKSSIRSRSNPQGEGFNELTFDDNKGLEEIYLHAQRDLREEVLNDHFTWIKRHQENKVDHNQSEIIGENQTLEVKEKRTKTVHGDEERTIEGTRTTTVHKKETVTLKDERETSVTGNVTDTFLADRKYDLSGSETIEVGRDRTEHVVGTWDLTTDQCFRLTQGGTKLEFTGDHVTLEGGNFIRVTHGSGEIEVANDGSVKVSSGSKITLECGQSRIVLSSSKIELTSVEVNIFGQQGALKLDAQGAALNGPQVKIAGTALTEIKGGILKLN